MKLIEGICDLLSFSYETFHIEWYDLNSIELNLSNVLNRSYGNRYIIII